jgi:hypothetical protein
MVNQIPSALQLGAPIVVFSSGVACIAAVVAIAWRYPQLRADSGDEAIDAGKSLGQADS